MRFLKRSTVLVATVVVALAGLLGQTGAIANTSTLGVLNAVGTGTTAPGLTTTCTVQTSVTGDSSVAVVAGDTTQIGNFHFAGASNGCETLTSGAGSGTLSGMLAGSVSYVRTGNIATFSGTVNGHGWIVFICVYVWTSMNPASTNGWYCVGVWA